jgi:uncharacterized membrane protein
VKNGATILDDRETVELLHDHPQLLAIADAVRATQGKPARSSPPSPLTALLRRSAPARRRSRALRWAGALVALALASGAAAIAVTTTASGGQSIDNLLSQVQHSFGDHRLLSASVNGSTLTVTVAAPDEPSAVSATFEAQMLASAVHDAASGSGQTPIDSVQFVDANGAAITGYGAHPVGTEPNGAPLPKIPALATGACESAAHAAQAEQARVPQAPLTVQSVLTLPYAGGACAFKFQIADPSTFDAPLDTGKLATVMGNPNERAFLVEVDDPAGVPQFVDSYSPSGGGSAYIKPGTNILFGQPGFTVGRG